MGCSASTQLSVSPKFRIEQEEDCESCFDSFPLSQFRTACQEGHKVCKGCMREHLKAELKANSFKSIACLEPGCTHGVHERVIKELLSKEDYDKFSIVRVAMACKGSSDFVMCPKPGCCHLMGNDARLDYAICGKCSYRFCLKCKHAEHVFHSERPLTCLEVLDRLQKDRTAEEKATEQYLMGERSIQPCPDCGALVQWAGGCTHMTCVCEYQFCMECGVNQQPIFTHGNHYHAPSCSLYRKCCANDCLKGVNRSRPFTVRCKLDKHLPNGRPDRDGNMKNACPGCKSSGRICAPPPDMQRTDRARAFGIFVSSSDDPACTTESPTPILQTPLHPPVIGGDPRPVAAAEA